MPRPVTQSSNPAPERNSACTPGILHVFQFGSLIFFALLLALPAGVHAEKPASLKHTGRVNDFAGVLSSSAKERIEALCAEVDQKAAAQIVVVTIKSLENTPIEDFANHLFRGWGIGKKGAYRGVLLLLAVADHQYRTEVGFGLEAILPDGKVGGFGRDVVPLLRQNNYDGAVLQVTSQVARAIAEDKGVALTTLALPHEAPQPARSSPSLLFWFLVIVVAALFLAALLFPILVTVVTLWQWKFGGPAAREDGWWALWRYYSWKLKNARTASSPDSSEERSSSRSAGSSGLGSTDGSSSGSQSGSSDSGGFSGGDSGGGGASGSW